MQYAFSQLRKHRDEWRILRPRENCTFISAACISCINVNFHNVTHAVSTQKWVSQRFFFSDSPQTQRLMKNASSGWKSIFQNGKTTFLSLWLLLMKQKLSKARVCETPRMQSTRRGTVLCRVWTKKTLLAPCTLRKIWKQEWRLRLEWWMLATSSMVSTSWVQFLYWVR